MLLTFFLAVIGWIIFRAESIGQAWEYYLGMMQFGILRVSYRFFTLPEMWPTNLFIVIMLLVEWLLRRKLHGLEISKIRNGWLRFAIYYAIILLILGSWGQEQTFIYFQF